MTFPVPNSCTFFLFSVVVPSVTLMLYSPSADISFRVFCSPAFMFWVYVFFSVPIVISIVFVYRMFPVFFIISSSFSIMNFTVDFSPIVNLLSTSESA